MAISPILTKRPSPVKKRNTLGDPSGTKRLVFCPYNNRSKSYRALSRELKLYYRNWAHFGEDVQVDPAKMGNDRVVVNWGSGNIPTWAKTSSKTLLNPASVVNICRNKVKFFNLMKTSGGARIPEFTSSLEEATQWVADGIVVMGRQECGSCGEDIVFYEDSPEDFNASTFWVQYKKKKSEFRVHVFGGEVISLQQKVARVVGPDGETIDRETLDFRIRNHKNGFIFARNDIEVPKDVTDQALAAVKAVAGLDFGAVDVIYNAHENKAYVLEINTAPGLEGTTLEHYVQAFSKYL
jgi:hypothetical protein